MQIENIVSQEQLNNPSSTPENKCKDIYTALKSHLNWKWDDRFRVVLAEFDVRDIESIQSILTQHFNLSWDQSTAMSAPEKVHAAIDFMGGMMGEQKFFTSVLENETLIYGAWWPWGNGQTISIRIGLLPSVDNAFKRYFGL
jgi:hypothetical protein